MSRNCGCTSFNILLAFFKLHSFLKFATFSADVSGKLGIFGGGGAGRGPLGPPREVDSAIQLQGNNRVLKKRPPPISDEEQRLNRRQRCTLSQLRSGHCHLLQDYKHRVFGEPSDICTDCGASPQDVRHLFACTTHPTDLSPEDLWRNPVRSIRAFSYLDNGNLD